MRQMIRLFAIGIVMGAAEVVPGISGGTIAFVTGIYERLVNALKQFNPMLLVELKNHGVKQAWEKVDANFVLSLFSGMGVAIILFAGAVSYMLAEQPIFIWSFFFGLVLASVWLVAKQISRFGRDIALAVGVGVAFGILVTSVVPIELEPTSFFIFLGGAVAVCAWILPGLSGSFVLLTLGLYPYVIEAIKNLDVVFLLTLGLGMTIGIVSFANVLSDLLKNHRNETLGVLTGFMLGSLNKLWPWKHTVSYQLKPDGSQIPLVQDPVSPFAYSSLTGANPDLWIAASGLVLGGIGVIGLNLLSRSKQE